MLPPGLFQPSHSSTLVTVGCLARNPPVRIRARATGVGCEAPAGSRSFEGFEPELSSGSNPAGFAGIWMLLLSVEDGGMVRKACQRGYRSSGDFGSCDPPDADQ
jgi:hypothetical protein